MTSDQIKQFIETNYPEIVCRKLDHRWSFWYHEIAWGPGYSTRIARVEERSRGGTEFKRSVTSLLERSTVLEDITSEQKLRRVFDEELRLWKENFGL